MLLRRRHRFAAAVHFSAFVLLGAFAVERVGGFGHLDEYRDQFWMVNDKFSLEPRRWLFRCYQNGTFTDATSSCPDGDKRLYVQTPENVSRINILGLACFYVLWSALGHLVASMRVEWTRILRWTDYAFTAPVMLVVLGLAFGADSVTAIVGAPSLLAVLLLVAAVCEPNPRQPFLDIEWQRQLAIVLSFTFYIPVLVPVLTASWRITTERSDALDSQGVGTAPDFVFWFSVFIVIAFTSFAAVYLYDLCLPAETEFDRNRWYIYLSMVSKTWLHLFLGLSVIEQSNSVGVDEPDPATSDMDTLAIGLGGAAGLTVLLAGANYAITAHYFLNHPDKDKFGLEMQLLSPYF